MIEISSAHLRATLLPRGAALSGLWVKGHSHSLVLGAPDPQEHTDHLTYFGSIVGPVANRIAGAEVIIDSTTWHMDANEGTTCLHSGPDGLHAQDWHVAEHGAATATMICNLAHGQGGLPGNRVIRATYRLTDEKSLRLDIRAMSDRATVMNLAQHPYWNLDGTPTIANHKLQVAAEHYLPVDAQTLPTGQPEELAGTAYDFRNPRVIPTNRTLDANLCLSTARLAAPRKVATLTGKSGATLEIYSTEPGLQVYNGAGLVPTSSRLHDGRELVPFAGVALEPQAWPDAPNNAGYPSILLPAGMEYHQVTDYHISA